MGQKKERKIMDEDVNSRSVCKYCGHKNKIPAYQESTICYWCKNKVKNCSLLHFKYKLNKERKEINEKN